jgi:NitT/TauT family transport system permease protein
MGTDIFSDPKVTHAILLALYELMIAYALSVVVGLALGIAIGLTEIARKGVMPIVLLLYAVPQVVLLPLFVLIFGIGPTSKIAFGFSHGVFPILLNTVAGMRNVNLLFIRSALSQGASRLQMIRHVIFPNMVPTVFAGMRLAMTVTLLGVLLAELFASINGVGYFAQAFGQKYDPSPLFGLIVILAVAAVALNELVRLIERRFSHWKQ